MEKVQIDLTITMGETCSQTMSFNEAKELYNSLHKIFDKEQIVHREGKWEYPTDQSYKNNKKEPIVTRETRASTIPNKRVIDNNTGSQKQSGCGSHNPNRENQMSASAKRVKEARERAASKTRGCGS